MFIFDILSGTVNSSNLLSRINAPWYHTRTGDFLRVDFHRTNYGVHDPLNGAVRGFNEFAGLFDLYIYTTQHYFFRELNSTILHRFSAANYDSVLSFSQHVRFLR
jgi:hypothetical protein